MPLLFTHDALPAEDPPTNVLVAKTLVLAVFIFGFVQLVLGVIAVGM